MIGTFEGRIAKCEGKFSEKAKKMFYRLTFIQGEGSDFVSMENILSDKEYPTGKATLRLLPNVFNNKVGYSVHA